MLLNNVSATYGRTISGANVENAAYPVGTCAERVALGTAVVAGYKLGSFAAIAVSTDTEVASSPCGMCRQFIREFCDLKTPIVMFNKDGKYVVKLLEEVCPAKKLSFYLNCLLRYV